MLDSEDLIGDNTAFDEVRLSLAHLLLSSNLLIAISTKAEGSDSPDDIIKTMEEVSFLIGEYGAGEAGYVCPR